ncbi:MAG TPA: hypothetical protein VLZ81_09225, partial [Blastocatellia bacterium]|nr:hypothetical protein [Blastocatellia bacterium]
MKYELEVFRLGGAFQLWEDRRAIGMLNPAQASFDVAYSKLIFSCWDEGWSKSWRVVSGEIDSGGLKLACTRKMGLDRCMLELRRGPGASGFIDPCDRSSFDSSLDAGGADDCLGQSWNSPCSLDHADPLESLKSLIESSIPGMLVERMSRSRDARRGISSSHVRLTLKEVGRRKGLAHALGSIAAGIAVGDDKDQSVIDGSLAAGLIWADALRDSGSSVTGLVMFAPSGRTTTLASRLTMIDHGRLPVHLYEVDLKRRAIAAVRPFDQGDLADNLRKTAEGVVWPDETLLNAEISSTADSIVRIAPEFVETQIRDGGVGFSIRGLDFARLSGDGRLYAGLPGQRIRVGDGNRRYLESLIRQIISERT